MFKKTRNKSQPPEKNLVRGKNLPKELTPLFKGFGLNKEKQYFVENLSMLTSSGMTIVLALDSIRTGLRSRRMKKTLDELKDDVQSGFPLWQALEKTRIFRTYVISLIRIGEESGRLSENLKVISLQEERDRMFRSKLNSAMIYPVFILSLTPIVGISIAWFILPKLTIVFSQLNVELPVLTKLLISFGGFLGEKGIVVVPIFVLIFVTTLFFVFSFKKTKFVGQQILFHIPGIKNLILQVEIARFGYLLGTLLDAGLPIVNALESLHQATTFLGYKKMYIYLRDSIENGNSFQKSFASYAEIEKLIPYPIQQMIITGEQSGSLSETLLKIGKIFETKIETTTKNLSVILEPVLLVIVWFGVVGVALAVILPIYNLIGGFGG
ncbi:type II secretion system F family protein [Candidatus Wolfebacteria bacterium]|nr:type II secretion system F family protein [Candidatus Wolfebacteria bacterium]